MNTKNNLYVDGSDDIELSDEEKEIYGKLSDKEKKIYNNLPNPDFKKTFLALKLKINSSFAGEGITLEVPTLYDLFKKWKNDDSLFEKFLSSNIFSSEGDSFKDSIESLHEYISDNYTLSWDFEVKNQIDAIIRNSFIEHWKPAE